LVRTFQSLKLSPNEQKQPIGPSQLLLGLDAEELGRGGELRDLPELYLLLADEIEDPHEKKRFIRKAISVARPR